jgi:hypothetical protein
VVFGIQNEVRSDGMTTIIETTARPPEHELDWAEDDETEVLTRAETAECTCPDFCERDHGNE